MMQHLAAPTGFLANSFNRIARPSRSPSSASTASTTSSHGAATPARRSYHAQAVPQPFYSNSLDSILAEARNTSFTSLTSMSLQSVRSERRPACFSVMEEREEREQFGSMLGVLEPRDTVCWWGLGEVLEGNALESQILA